MRRRLTARAPSSSASASTRPIGRRCARSSASRRPRTSPRDTSSGASPWQRRRRREDRAGQ
eukprot:14113962-Alexandrium_andersonii.AAC.1